MPVAYKFDLKDVLDACRYYFEQTGRRITFEYSLVGGVNDSSEGCQRTDGAGQRPELSYQPDPGQSDQREGLRAVGQSCDPQFQK